MAHWPASDHQRMLAYCSCRPSCCSQSSLRWRQALDQRAWPCQARPATRRHALPPRAIKYACMLRCGGCPKRGGRQWLCSKFASTVRSQPTCPHARSAAAHARRADYGTCIARAKVNGRRVQGGMCRGPRGQAPAARTMHFLTGAQSAWYVHSSCELESGRSRHADRHGKDVPRHVQHPG